MQLDRTGIVIRERGLLDQMDLALKVARRHIGPLTLAWLAGVVPLAIFNHWLLADVSVLDPDAGPSMRYLYLMAVLIGWEIPLATSFMTLYLSRALFLDRPRPRDLVRQFVSRFWQIFWLQIVVRGLLAFGVVRASLTGADEAMQFILGSLLLLTWTAPFVFYPLMNEILLLEGNPLRRRRGGASTIGRTMSMHGYAVGDLLARWLLLTLIGALLVGSMWFAVEMLRSMMTFQPEGGTLAWGVFLPFVTWMVVGYFTVVRFLSYLDLRTRIEGWEVELLMRAEGARLARQIA